MMWCVYVQYITYDSWKGVVILLMCMILRMSRSHDMIQCEYLTIKYEPFAGRNLHQWHESVRTARSP